MRFTRPALCVFALALFSALPVAAQAGASEVSGQVVDVDGNPIANAVVRLVNTTSSTIHYEVKTNKKGKYFLPNLLYYEPGIWKVTVKADGYVPKHIKVESRTSNRTLVGELDSPMGKNSTPEVRVAAFGKATVDFVMISEQALAQQLRVRTEEAQKEAEKKLDPLTAAARSMTSGDLEGAAKHFAEAVKEHPDDAEVRESYARILFQIHRLDEAELQATKASELDSKRLGAHLILYGVHVARHEYDKAAEELALAREIAPDDPIVVKQSAWLATQTNDTDLAIASYEKMVKQDPGDVDAWISLGNLYASKGDATRSEEAYRKVVELDPENAYQTFYNIGALIMNRDNPTQADVRKAIASFRKAVEIKPDYAPAHKELAFALLNTGDRKGARRELECYLAVNPKAPDAGQIRAMADALPK